MAQAGVATSNPSHLKIASGGRSPAPAPGSPEPDRYAHGWRAGKPVEDPEKMKAWGYVTAQPSEYLVVVRSGQIDPRRSGQGARIFKWPWESIAVIPTTLQKLQFTADQITRERVGVCVTGVAVYRIADPTLAYRVLNFSYAERAGEKLALTLQEMFIGASRRLIANLSLEECLTRRKEAIAAFLMEEISPVLAGKGRATDTTPQGWGVVIDTIEIQDVKVLSEEVFENLQAPFRHELAMKSELAELERERAVAQTRATTDRQVAEANLTRERETRALKARTEADMAEMEARENLRAAQARAQARTAELESEEQVTKRRLKMQEELARREAESQAAIAARQAELARDRELRAIAEEERRRKASAAAEVSALSAEEEVRRQQHTQRVADLEQQRQREEYEQATLALLRERTAELEQAVKARELQSTHLAAMSALEQEKARAQLEVTLAGARVMKDLVNVTLPQMAEALGGGLSSMTYTHVGGGSPDNPVSMVAGAFAQCLGVARSFGIEPEKILADLASSRRAED